MVIQGLLLPHLRHQMSKEFQVVNQGSKEFKKMKLLWQGLFLVTFNGPLRPGWHPCAGVLQYFGSLLQTTAQLLDNQIPKS